MLTRTRSNSFVVGGALTRSVWFEGRSTGQGDNNALIASVPHVPRPQAVPTPELRSIDQPYDKRFRSTYR